MVWYKKIQTKHRLYRNSTEYYFRFGLGKGKGIGTDILKQPTNFPVIFTVYQTYICCSGYTCFVGSGSCISKIKNSQSENR